MFLSCDQGSNNNSGGGMNITNIINNNYVNLPKSVSNFTLWPTVPSEHFSVSSSAPITKIGNNISSTAPIVLSFHEDVLFVRAVVAALSGSSSMIFYNEAGAPVKTIAFSSAVAADTVIFRSVRITLDGGTQLSQFEWQSAMNYITRRFDQIPSGTQLLELYPIEISGAVATGSAIEPVVTELVMKFASPTIVYAASFTGTLSLYRGANEVYRTNGPNVSYYDPVDSAVFDGLVTSISVQNMTNTNYRSSQYSTVSALAESHYFSYSTNNMITFYEPTFISGFTQSAQSTIIINGNTYVGAPSNWTGYGLISSISGVALTSLSIANREHHECSVPPFNLINFDQFAVGAIVIDNDYFHIESTDQLSHPTMCYGEPSGTGIIISSNADSLSIFTGTGTYRITFKQPTYVSQLLFDIDLSGTVSAGGKIYAIEEIVSLRDWVNRDCMAVNEIDVTISGGSGRLIGILLSTVLTQYVERDTSNYIVENYDTPTVEFASVTFDTNVASALGTPNAAFGGPGIGFGGASTNGLNDQYLGRASQSNIIFDRDRWVRRVVLINSLLGYQLSLYDGSGNLISSIYTGNYGPNSVCRVPINRKVRSIEITGNMAIAEIEYSGDARTVVGLSSNSATPTAITSVLSGVYMYSVVGMNMGAVAMITASKSTQSVVGTSIITANAAPTGESLDVSWPIASPIMINHATLRPGAPEILYYIVRQIK